MKKATKKTKNARCEIRMDADTKRRAVIAAARRGVSLSAYIHELVEGSFKHQSAAY